MEGELITTLCAATLLMILFAAHMRSIKKKTRWSDPYERWLRECFGKKYK